MDRVLLRGIHANVWLIVLRNRVIIKLELIPECG